MSALKRDVASEGTAWASKWIEANVHSLASAIVARTFAADARLKTKHGASGRSKCLEDAMYHLHFLVGAIAVDSENIFVDYVGWLKIILCSRGIPESDVEATLRAMLHVFSRKAPQKITQIAHRFVAAALAALPSLPDNAPSFLASDQPYAVLANDFLKSLLLFKRDEGVAAVVREMEAGMSIRDLFQYVVAPVQKEIGRLWQENRITVVQEHYCTAACDMLLISFRRKFLGTRRNLTAMAICAENEEHCLAIKMFSDLLASDGWRIAYIGPKCPNRDVLNHLRKNDTDLIAISVTTPLHLTKAERLIAEIKALPGGRTPAVIIGGAVLNSDPGLWRRMGADGWGATVLDGLEVSNRLVSARD